LFKGIQCKTVYSIKKGEILKKIKIKENKDENTIWPALQRYNKYSHGLGTVVIAPPIL
jgi:hypothetical protein